MSKEQDYFNCEEDYEHDYVASLFEETQQVKKWLKENCNNNNIHNNTHIEVYKMIKAAGYTMKNF